MEPKIEEKQSFWSKFLKFLTYGGFLLILFAAAAIFILVSSLMK